MKKDYKSKILVIGIVIAFIFSAWMFNEKEEEEIVGEQIVLSQYIVPISEYHLISGGSSTFKCRLYTDYILKIYSGNNYVAFTRVNISHLSIYSTKNMGGEEKIGWYDSNLNEGRVVWDGSRTYIEIDALPIKNESIFIGDIGFDVNSFQYLYTFPEPSFYIYWNYAMRIGQGEYLYEITPAMMHEIQQVTLSNFQQLPIDLTHEKVTFNTNINTIPKYYLNIGGTWHLQNTGSSSKNHNYSFIVSEYISTPYKIEFHDPYGRKLDTEKTGTIRTVGPEICGDGIDNDNDGLTDWDDTECVKVTITKTSENIGTTTYYGIFLITGDAESHIEYQKGSGSTKTVSLTKVGQDYVLSLENLTPNSGYNGIIYAKDINFPENNDDIPLTFTTLQEGGIIEVTEEGTAANSFNCKFKINADTINTLTFTYRTSGGSINEVDPNDQGNKNYAVLITNLSAGDYEYIIETSTDRGDDSYEGTFTIAELPPETTTPPPTSTSTPTPSIPPSPQETDYTMIFLVLVVLCLVGVILYMAKFKKKKKKRRK